MSLSVEQILDLLSWILLLGGSFFCIVGGLGVVRFDNFYVRAHAAGITDTLGAGMILTGLMLQGGLTHTTVKLAFVLVLLAITSPTATHALVKAAYAAGIKVESPASTNDRRDDRVPDRAD